MGHQIHAGDDEICFSRGASMVAGWCYRVDPQEPPPHLKGYALTDWHVDRQGVTGFDAEAVRRADALVPLDYEAAAAGGFLADSWPGEPITRNDFEVCRDFLANAAAGGHDITGSY